MSETPQAEDPPTIEEAADAVRSIRGLTTEVHAGVADASEEIDGTRAEVDKLQEHATRASDAIEQIVEIAEMLNSGSVHSRYGGLNTAFEKLEGPFSITDGELQQFLDTIEAALEQAEDGVDAETEVTIEDTIYEVSFTAVEDAPTAAEDFTVWLFETRSEHGVKVGDIHDKTALDGERVVDIETGTEPEDEEMRILLDFFHDEGYIGSDVYTRAEERFL